MSAVLAPAPDAARHRRGGDGLTGFRPLLAVTVRQEARQIGMWTVLIAALSASSVVAYEVIFPDAQDRAALAATLGGNPALSLIFGPARDLMTSDGFNAWRSGQLGALFAALMAIFMVVRNSRAAEDSGQAELLASGVLARASRLAAAAAIAVIASVALGVACFAVTVAAGGGLAATLTLSASFTAAGLMFGGVAAITAQLGSDARAATSIAIAVLGISYALRGYTDASGAPGWVSWLNPLGWLETTRPGTGNNPWPLLPAAAFAVITIAAGFALHRRRDFGQGVIASRPGPEHAGIAGSIWGAALKLNRGALISWLIAFAFLGTIFGTLAGSIGDLITGNPAMTQVLAQGGAGAAGLTFAFLATILRIIAIIAAVMGVQFALRVHSEETSDRVEPLLAGPLRRHAYLASHAVIALASTAVAMLVAGIALGLVAHGADSAVSVGDVIVQALVTVPAVWVLVALALAAVGARPSLRVLGWLGILVTFALTMLGPTFNLPENALAVSPLHHVPDVTNAAPGWIGLGWLGVATVIFLVIAFTGYSRRDLL